jgi:hypothetical protein
MELLAMTFSKLSQISTLMLLMDLRNPLDMTSLSTANDIPPKR